MRLTHLSIRLAGMAIMAVLMRGVGYNLVGQQVTGMDFAARINAGQQLFFASALSLLSLALMVSRARRQGLSLLVLLLGFALGAQVVLPLAQVLWRGSQTVPFGAALSDVAVNLFTVVTVVPVLWFFAQRAFPAPPEPDSLGAAPGMPHSEEARISYTAELAGPLLVVAVACTAAVVLMDAMVVRRAPEIAAFYGEIGPTATILGTAFDRLLTSPFNLLWVAVQVALGVAICTWAALSLRGPGWARTLVVGFAGFSLVVARDVPPAVSLPDTVRIGRLVADAPVALLIGCLTAGAVSIYGSASRRG